MSDARAEILRRIGAALDDVPAAERPQDVAVARDYRQSDDPQTTREALIDRFTERVLDYAADVRVVEAEGVAGAVSRACADWRLGHVAVPTALPERWRPDGVQITEDVALGARELDGIDGAVTGCAAAIAETGTLVLDGSDVCGRRLMTLIPDHYVCIVRAEQIVGGVPAAVRAVAPVVREQRRPITLISGPSASSDIELSRVEGVHGPRRLLIIVVR